MFLIAAFIAIGCGQQEPDATPVRVMSYNIKYDNKSDTVNNWEQRKEQLVNMVKFYEPDFIGTQEGLLNQLEYLDQELSTMRRIGVGRADGKKAGEFSAIYYDSTRFQLEMNSDSTIWLSKTPGKVSKNWDAALPRILTWGKFNNRKIDQDFFVFNTHFDHVGDTARAKSAKLIIETIEKLAKGYPVILTGDFNFTEKEPPYAIITDSSSRLKDAYYASALPHVGPLFSYEGFDVLDAISKRRIDYIFVNDFFDVQKHAIISNFREGKYTSDHLPVLVDVQVK